MVCARRTCALKPDVESTGCDSEGVVETTGPSIGQIRRGRASIRRYRGSAIGANMLDKQI